MLVSQSSSERKMTGKIVDISSAKRVSLDPSKSSAGIFSLIQVVPSFMWLSEETGQL